MKALGAAVRLGPNPGRRLGRYHPALNATFTAFGHKLWTVDDTRNRVRVSLRESFPVMFGDRWEQARDIFYKP